MSCRSVSMCALIVSDGEQPHVGMKYSFSWYINPTKGKILSCYALENVYWHLA
jgi:hypothetical protein